MPGATRGFLGRRARDPRLPPGQYDVGRDWPVLTAEPTPRIAPETWSITVDGMVENPTTWTWDEAHRLAPSAYRGDIHCVTTWSKFDTRFAGVSVDTLLEAARPTAEAHFVIATSKTGYTTTLQLMQIRADKGLVKRDEAARTHIYAAVAGEEQTQRVLVKDLVDRAFGGSAAALVLRALSEGTSDDELQEIRKLIDDYREKRS